MLVCDYGNCSLQDLITYRREIQQQWAPKAIAHICKEIVCGFYYMSVEPLYMYHRDIKPGNIVFSQRNLTYMIIDFGETEYNVNENIPATYQNLQEALRGTPRYLDPILYDFYYDVRYRNDYNQEEWDSLPCAKKYFSYEKADVYSLGQTFLEMIDLDFAYS